MEFFHFPLEGLGLKRRVIKGYANKTDDVDDTTSERDPETHLLLLCYPFCTLGRHLDGLEGLVVAYSAVE